MNNDEIIKEHLRSEDVPEQLSPENIQAMLETESAKNRRKNISVFKKTAATAAALVIVAGGYLGSVKLIGNNHKSVENFTASDAEISASAPMESDEDKNDTPKEFKPVHQEVNAPYMCGAKSYEVIYTMMADAHERRMNGDYIGYGNDLWYGAGYVSGGGAGFDSDSIPKDPFPTDEQMNGVDLDDQNSGGEPYSQTYDQEEGVLESDLVKTDGKHIYYLYAERKGGCYNTDTGEYIYEYHQVKLRAAAVNKGKFSKPVEVDLPMYFNEDEMRDYTTSADGLYIYDDMLIVITGEGGYRGDSNKYEWCTSVSFYTLDDEPQLIGTYVQSGGCADVRISPEGYMYLITGDSNDIFSFEESCDPYDLSTYIPSCGCDGDVDFLPANDILIPKELDTERFMSYTIIGSIDLTVSAQFTNVDTKALAGTGSGDSIYCSADNLYAYAGWDTADITRISISQGNIVPAASCTLDGHVKDQFSLSEYEGHLRVAANVSRWIYDDEGEYVNHIIAKSEEYNLVYVLDMDLNVVGQTERFGENEHIKSANFNGSMGYVVTYRQTDPLFGIDLSDPENPVITDEFKINGYSTYLQRWEDGLLLGFGADADENGRENGVKLSMFDVSDSGDLKVTDTLSINDSEDSWAFSDALWDRKALLIAPEKDLIGVPVEVIKEYKTASNGYRFFSYDGGQFNELGWLGLEYENTDDRFRAVSFDRAVYIGDHVYIVSGDCFMSADIATITEVDSLSFE